MARKGHHLPSGFSSSVPSALLAARHAARWALETARASTSSSVAHSKPSWFACSGFLSGFSARYTTNKNLSVGERSGGSGEFASRTPAPPEKFCALRPQPVRVGVLAVALFHEAGQLPHAAEKAGLFSLHQGDQPVSLRPELKDGDRSGRFFAGFYRQGVLRSGLMPRAHLAHGTPCAIGFLGQADSGAQVHQRLVEVAGPHARNQRQRLGADGFPGGRGIDGDREVEDAAHDSKRVRVDGRATLPEGDAGDCPRHVGADPRQGQQRIVRFGRRAPALIHHLPCCAVQVSRAAVIAEPLPFGEDGV